MLVVDGGIVIIFYVVQSLYYMCVYHRCFSTPAYVCLGGLEEGVFSACSWLALVAGDVHMYVCVCVCIYIYIHTRVGVHMHSCRHILFIYNVQSLYCMCVYHRCFSTPACVCVGGLEVGFVSACSWLALVAGVGGYLLTRVEIGVLSCMFLDFCGS